MPELTVKDALKKLDVSIARYRAAIAKAKIAKELITKAEPDPMKKVDIDKILAQANKIYTEQVSKAISKVIKPTGIEKQGPEAEPEAEEPTPPPEMPMPPTPPAEAEPTGTRNEVERLKDEVKDMKGELADVKQTIAEIKDLLQNEVVPVLAGAKEVRNPKAEISEFEPKGRVLSVTKTDKQAVANTTTNPAVNEDLAMIEKILKGEASWAEVREYMKSKEVRW